MPRHLDDPYEQLLRYQEELEAADREEGNYAELLRAEAEAFGSTTRSTKAYKTANWGTLIPNIEGTLENATLAEVQSEVPRAWSVTCVSPGVRPASVLGDIPADANDAFLRIEFGVAGARGVVEVDVARGWSAVVTGDYVRVILFVPNFVQAALFPAPLDIGAFVTPFEGGRQSPVLTRSVRYSTLNATDFQQRGIPQFAERCWVRTNGQVSSDAWSVEQLNLGGATLLSAFRFGAGAVFTPTDMQAGLILQPEATTLGLRNLGVNPMTLPTVVYQLRF